MDKYYVITPTSDLDELENEMVAWCNLPFEFRMRSNDECIRRYNMTNIELYNLIKSNILKNYIPADPIDMIGSSISEGTVTDDGIDLPDPNYLNLEETDYQWKKQIAAQLELSPNIVIINPFRGDIKDYDLNDLEEKINKYYMLLPKYRLFSNSYSVNLWGYNVPNMYAIMRKKLLSMEGIENDVIITLGESKYEKCLSPIVDLANERIFLDDKIGLLNIKLDACAKMGINEKAIYNSIVKDIDKAIYERDFLDILPKVVPFFTISEMNEMGYYNNEASNINPKDYYKTIKEKMNLLSESEIANSEDTQRIIEEVISLGWNPSVEINEKNIQFARMRQAKWLKENACTVVDIRNIKSNSIVTEASSMMKSMYKKFNLYPVYIVLSYSDTIFGKIVRKVKHSTYSHAGIATDSNLQHILTFKKSLKDNGFSVETVDNYLAESNNALLSVLCVFVDLNTKNKLEAAIKHFIAKQDKTKYGFGNLFNIFINRSKDDDPENLSLVCSQFVDVILKMVNLDLLGKPSNLAIPQDFSDVSDNKKVYKVYEGLAKEYNEKSVEDLIRNLFLTTSKNEIRYSEVIESAMNSYIEAYSVTTENAEANAVLEEIRSLLKPESIIVEGRLPISFNNKGDMIIKLYKSLEQEYQEAHRLLKEYGENNIEGLKHELARLFYVNSAIEKKIKKMEKADDNYKKFIDLRARVLNDFKKYFKIVIEKEPDFNFSDYFQKSEYYNGNIIIDNSILKFTGKLIKKFLKSLGV